MNWEVFNLHKMRRRLAGISIRVRVLMLVVACVTVFASSIALVRAATILDAYQRLNGSALPMLTLAKSTRTELARMTPFFRSIPTLDTNLTDTAAQAWINEAFDPVKRDLVALRNFDIPKSLVDQLSAHIEASEKSALSLLADQVERTKSLAQRDSQIDELLRAERRTRLTLDELSFLEGKRHSSALSEHVFSGALNTEFIEQQLTEHANFVTQLSNINFLLEQIITLASRSELDTSPVAAPRDGLLTSQKLRVMIGYLAKLPETAERNRLAKQIAEIRALLFKSGGIFELQSRLTELRERQSQEIEDQFPTMAEISDIAAELVSLSLAIVDESSHALQSAIKAMIWQLVISSLLVALIVGIINFAIIERQFFRRINVLNTSVRAIANGELTHPIPVSGADELGDMARALRVFKETSQDLRRSNTELQKFAYVAAHDLRTPLNAIRDLSSWTLEDDSNHLSEESNTYLTLLIERTDRLSQLLADLLSYARVGQENPEAELVDLKALISELHQTSDRAEKFDIQYSGPRHPVLCPRTALTQILGNLIDNAIQHHDRDSGQISIAIEMLDQSMMIDVTDDGPGIAPQYHQKVFEIFQTLRPRDMINGNGMGLSILKKILDRHGGQIEIYSDPACRRGTRFCIIFPLETNSPDLRATLTKYAAE